MCLHCQVTPSPHALTAISHLHLDFISIVQCCLHLHQDGHISTVLSPATYSPSPEQQLARQPDFTVRPGTLNTNAHQSSKASHSRQDAYRNRECSVPVLDPHARRCPDRKSPHKSVHNARRTCSALRSLYLSILITLTD
jgi:hypothetical protein